MTFYSPAYRPGPIHEPIFQFLDTNGDGTGDSDVIGDYESTADIFYIGPPPPNEFWHIERMVIQVTDVGAFDAGKYGNNLELVNGLTVRKQDDAGTVDDLTGGKPIITNAGWGGVCYDVADVSFGQGDNYLGVRWTFAKSGWPLWLDGDGNNERLELVANDDFTDLTGQTFMVQGWKERLPI